MEIGKYISQALINHSAVYVEGLGVFRKIHRPSTYDKVRQVYLPPLNYVEFDSLDQDGFSLSTFVQQADSIQKTEAADVVRAAVENLHAKVEENSEVYLETLGHLIKYGNALIFKPQDLTGFALEPIPYVPEAGDNTEAEKADEEPLESNELIPEENAITGVEPENTDEADHISEEDSATQEADPEIEPVGIFNVEESVPEETLTEEYTSEEKPIAAAEQLPADALDDQPEEFIESRKGNRGIWYLLAGLLALGIIGGLWYYNQIIQTGTADAPEEGDGLTERPITIPVEDTTAVDSASVDIFAVDLSDSTNLTMAEEAPAQESILPTNHSWYIVIGAHRSYSQAEDEVERYKRQGHSRVRMLPKNPSDTYIRVIWDSYTTKEEADSALRYVQKNFVADAWHRAIKK